MTPRTTPAILLLLSLTLPALTAQELQELRLDDGRVVTGTVHTDGARYVVQTRRGQVTVPIAEVTDSRDRTALQRALRDIAKRSEDSVFARINLARQARDFGLERELWQHLQVAIERLEADDAAEHPPILERLLRDLLAELEPEVLDRSLQSAPTSKRVAALLRGFRATTPLGERRAREELLVREANADALLRQHARRNPNSRQRIAALRALERRTLAGNHRFVLRTAVLDRSAEVREQAVVIARAGSDGDDATYMAAGLAHPNGKVRVRSADALAGLGRREAIELLVKAGPVAGSGLADTSNGTSTRGHVAFLQQRSYVRDFDVEVASAAFIADPQVDVLQSGSVLDVTVHGVYEVRTILRSYRKALKQLSGRDPGADPRAWASWLERLPAPTQAAETPGR